MLGIIIVFILVVALVLYTFLPTFLARIFHFNVMKKMKDSQSIALTFDDGPHPVYTPMLLDLLKAYHVKATFFVHGWKAKQYPDVVQRIQREGHLLGIHNYEHASNWWLTPRKHRKQLKETQQILKEITGSETFYYRPPWGLLNLMDLLQQKFKIILWTFHVTDWKVAGGSERLYSELMEKVKGGDVILLHDSGETFGADEAAPLQTIAALEGLFCAVADKNYQFVTVEQN